MTDNRTVRWSLFFGLVLMLLAVSSALASAPLQTSTATETPTVTPTFTPTATLTTTETVSSTAPMTLLASPTPIPTPLGVSPETAREPSGVWEYIAPASYIWYKMNDSRLSLEVWVSANGQSGLTLAIYAPDQKDLWTTKPVGRGSYNRTLPQYDLYWTGRSGASGTWYALLTNTTSTPISFNMNYKRVLHRTSDACAECHGTEYQWWDCYPPGSPGCTNLQEEYEKGYLK